MSINPLPQRLVIATRESPLALYQANHVPGLLRGLYPSLTVDLLGMTTKGDQIPDRSLAAVGGKGFLIKELEQAFEAKQAGPAVHSLKDVPMDKPPFVRIGLESLMMQVFKLFRSLNHLVGAQEQRRR